MIRITDLSKTYKSKKNGLTHALNGISFDLPDSGMIFIVGKSGSGKSTLLNIIGGLDDFDSGSVIVDGNNLKEMDHNDFNKYRSGYVSFIFQDHFLINELKVKDNISIGLNVINEHDEEKVKEMLDKVDLSNKLNSMPIELSGGERQRVAVARAIIKNPKLILCDEPTGNLDIKTTKLIFDLLKELSKDRLVVVVSHDMDNALIYADRIIEIFGGKILSDKLKNNNFTDELRLENNSIIIPQNKTINSSDIEFINNNKVPLKLGDEPFIETKEVPNSNRVIELKQNKFHKGRIHKISKSFIIRSLKRIMVTSIIISVILACFAVFNAIYLFNGNYEIIKKYEENDVESVLIRRNYFVEDSPGDTLRYDQKLFAISDSDIEALYNSGYKGKVYKVYNTPLVGNCNNVFYEDFPGDTANLSGFYAREGYGTICCDKEYLENKFGGIEVIKGDIFEKQGIIITDYLADSLIKNNIYVSSYDGLVGKFQFTNAYDSYIYIKAIIKTNYKEELKEYLDKANSNNGQIVNQENPEGDESFGEFCRLIKTKYGLAYTFSTDYLEDNISRDAIGWIPIRNITFVKDNEEVGVVKNFSAVKFAHNRLNKGEVAFNLRYFNTIFNTDYSVEDIPNFEPFDVTLRKYYDSTKVNSKEIYGETTFRVVEIYDSKTTHDIFIREDDYYLFKDVSTIPYALLLDDVKSTVNCIDDMSKDYYVCDSMIDAIVILSKYVFVFKKVAFLISIVLAVLAFVYLVFYGIGNINTNKVEIGVLKACGMRQRTISIIFITQQILLSILTIILSLIFSYLLVKVSDNLLITSVRKYAQIYVSGITLIRFRFIRVFISLVCSVVVIMFSCIIPILLLTRIKPMNIIKAKE